MPKDVNKRKSIRRAKTITEIAISAIIIALGVFAVKATLGRSSNVGVSPYIEATVDPSSTVPTTTENIDPNKILYDTKAFSTKDKFKGDLILVNEDYQYYGGDEDLISINGMVYDEDLNCFSAYDDGAQILRHVCRKLTDMLVDFNKETEYDDILIEGAYRTNDEQQALYDEDLEITGEEKSDRVALPGHSEHECGYALDFGINADGVEYDGTGKYDWINKNCWKYGFILRYTNDKTAITKIKYEPWHYRYVGIPHAYYMYSNQLSLEEYIDFLKNHAFEDNHLAFKDDNGTNYEVYYTASSDAEKTTSISVPTNRKYEISGNNVDGFIITVYVDEKVDNPEQAQITRPTVAPTTNDEDDEDDDDDESEEDSDDDDDDGDDDDSDDDDGDYDSDDDDEEYYEDDDDDDYYSEDNNDDYYYEDDDDDYYDEW